MRSPKVSVVVPVYNVEKQIEKCLDSILSQTFKDFEVIAVDDGATDNSGKILDSYAEKYPDLVRVIHQKNAGLGGARNTGIEAATGEYLAFIDSDDFLDADMLEILVSMVDEYNADIAACGLRYVTDSGKTWECVDAMPLNVRIDVKQDKSVLTVPPSAVNKLYKRTLFTESGIRYPSRVWFEDMRTTPKIFAIADGIVFTDKCPYNYYQREGSIIHNSNLDRNIEVVDALEDIFAYFRENGIYETFSEELEFLAVQAIFWDAPARILHSTAKHKLLKDFYNYTFANFDKPLNNKYFKAIVARKGIMGRVVLFCLKNRLYRLLYLLIKVRG